MSKIEQAKSDAIVAWKNFVNLIEALSLVAVGGYTIHGTLHGAAKSWTDVLFLSAAILIALIGAGQFFKHLAQKPGVRGE